MPTQLRVALWRVPTIVADSDIAGMMRNMISLYTHEQRLELLREAVDEAVRHFGPAKAGTKTINVFAVPEFFFANSHRLHFVDEHTKNLTIQGLKEISKRGDTLLFAGTVPWIKPMNRANGFAAIFQSSRYDRAIKRTQDTRALFNQGGAEPRSVATIRSAKDGTLTGTLYWAQNTAWVIRGGEVVLKYPKRLNGVEINPEDQAFLSAKGDSIVWVPGARTGSFTLEGIVFGLEICAEHNYQALQTQMGANTVADVQVVVSATMKVQPEKCAHVREGGYLLHCDAMEMPSVHRKAGGAFTLVTPSTPSAKPPLSATEITRRSDAIRENARVKNTADTLRDGQIALMTGLAVGTLHYYQLDL